jgi:hypothetical protein
MDRLYFVQNKKEIYQSNLLLSVYNLQRISVVQVRILSVCLDIDTNRANHLIIADGACIGFMHFERQALQSMSIDTLF